jgi:hypothetical protein
MKTEPNEPANPFFTWNVPGYGDCITIEDKNGSKQFLHYKEGLTKREYFAAMALQGYIASASADIVPCISHAASWSVKYADALIDELNKQEDADKAGK